MRRRRDATERPTNLQLEDQLCFALYAATNAVIRSYRPLLRAMGLTYPQYLVLMTLWQHDDVPVGTIGDRLELPHHAVGPILGRLESAGLIVRVPGIVDRRTVRVRLTEAGAALEARVAEVQEHVVCRTGLHPEALNAMRDQLRDLRSSMSEPESGLGPGSRSSCAPGDPPPDLRSA